MQHALSDMLHCRIGGIFHYVLTMMAGRLIGVVSIRSLLLETKFGLFSLKIFVKFISPAASTANMEPNEIY